MKTCVHCGKELTGRKLKYCNSHCSFWYKAIKKDNDREYFPSSKSQSLRMVRAGRSQMKGRVGCRYN